MCLGQVKNLLEALGEENFHVECMVTEKLDIQILKRDIAFEQITSMSDQGVSNY